MKLQCFDNGNDERTWERQLRKMLSILAWWSMKCFYFLQSNGSERLIRSESVAQCQYLAHGTRVQKLLDINGRNVAKSMMIHTLIPSTWIDWAELSSIPSTSPSRAEKFCYLLLIGYPDFSNTFFYSLSSPLSASMLSFLLEHWQLASNLPQDQANSLNWVA